MSLGLIGKKMAGHMGDKIRTIQNIEIIKTDTENNLIYLKGSIPGSKNSLVYMRKSTKSLNRKTSVEKFVGEMKQTVKQEAKTPNKKVEAKKPDDKKTTNKEQAKKK